MLLGKKVKKSAHSVRGVLLGCEEGQLSLSEDKISLRLSFPFMLGVSYEDEGARRPLGESGVHPHDPATRHFGAICFGPLNRLIVNFFPHVNSPS
jgi:hypothetical protein